MRRRLDEIKRLHCTHRCEHAVSADAPTAWRYAIVRREYAFAIIVSSIGGQFALHRRLALPDENGKKQRTSCDLLGSACQVDIDSGSLNLFDRGPIDSSMNYALSWWVAHAAQGQKPQGDAFWKALDALGKQWVVEAKKMTMPRIRCPQCGGAGYVKPVKG